MRTPKSPIQDPKNKMGKKENSEKERMTIVIVGHVDHGKSTVIGRLLTDSGSLPEGKLDQVKKTCERNAKPFEYAFILDALKDEQAQGITIDSARCFFETARRHYIVIDAPGHREFLKNMVTGAAHAEAALLVIDAQEGIQENSRRHGYLLSMLGIRQVAILVNKMDLVDYRKEVFSSIVEEYTRFLAGLNVEPMSFIPVSARQGDVIVALSEEMPWYQGPSVIGQLDAFKRHKGTEELPFRFPVQDIYKFTEEGDDRRIVAGTVESGSITVGDEVVFLPSYKRTVVRSVESFNVPEKKTARAGEAAGFTFDEQVYVKPGEIMVRTGASLPSVSSRFKANVFWMGRAPFIGGKTYKLKLASARVAVHLAEIVKVIDSSELRVLENKQQIDRYDVAEVVLEATKPVAFDEISEIEGTGRFVIVDHYEIAGGGIVLESLSEERSLFERHIREREKLWARGLVTVHDRSLRYKHKSKFVVFCGNKDMGKKSLARALEKALFEDNYKVYYLGMSNVLYGLDSDYMARYESRDEHIRRLGELARIVTDSGQIFITTISDIDDYDIEKLKRLNEPYEILAVNVGENIFSRFTPDLFLEEGEDTACAVTKVYGLLMRKAVIGPA